MRPLAQRQGIQMPIDAEQKGKLEFEVQRGLRISALINDEVVKETLNGLLHGIQNEWGICQDKDQREVLWHRFNAISELVAQLGEHINTAKMAQHQLDQVEKKS